MDRQNVEVVPRNVEREKLLSDGVGKVFGDMEKLAWGNLSLETKIDMFEKWRGMIPDLGVGDYVWLARDERGDVMLMDNANRLSVEEQEAVADELLKNDGGQTKMVRYLGNFWGLDDRHIQKLVEVNSKYSGKVVECLDNLEKVSRGKLAELLLEKEEGGLILSNLEKFQGEVRPLEIIEKMLDSRQFYQILSSSDNLRHEGVDIEAVKEKIYQAGGGESLIRYLGETKGDQRLMVDRLLRDGRVEEIGASLTCLKVPLAMEHALALIKGGFGYYFIHNKDKFVDCSNETVLEAMKEVGFFSGVVLLAEELGIEDTSGLVLEMVNQRGVSLDAVTGNLEHLRRLDSRILKLLIQDISNFDLVLPYLSSFARLSLDDANLVVKSREYVTSLVISERMDEQIYLDFNALLSEDLSVEQKWNLGKEWGFGDEKLMRLWLDSGRFGDLSEVISTNDLVKGSMLDDESWIDGSLDLVKDYHQLGESTKVREFVDLVASIFPSRVEEVRKLFPIEVKGDERIVGKINEKREWYKPVELEPLIYKFYLEYGLVNEVTMMRLRGEDPWGYWEDLEFVESRDRLAFSQIDESLERTTGFLFDFMKGYLIKAVSNELKQHQRGHITTNRVYVEDVGPEDMFHSSDEGAIRDYFVRAYRSFLDKGWINVNEGGRVDFGGEAWSKVARAGHWIWTEEAVKRKAFFVDHVVDLQHNYGHIFDKDPAKIKYDNDRLKKMLDRKMGREEVEEKLKFGLGAGYISSDDADNYRQLYRRLRKSPVRVKLGGE